MDVRLRPLVVADAHAVLDLRLANREHFQRGEPLRHDASLTLPAQQAELRATEEQRAAGTLERFGVYFDGRLAGWVSLSQIYRGAFQNAVLGYAIAAAACGRGVATEAVRQAVDHAWRTGLHRVQAAVVPANAASKRVLEKNRFRREGLALRYLQIAGTWADHDLFAKTVEER